MTSLDHAGIAARIPHAGRMCLLQRMAECSATHIVCMATNQREADHPLRTASGLLAAAGIEYAAQAMALHGALNAGSATEGPPSRGGALASVRQVRLHVARLDDVAGEITVSAQRLAGDALQALYSFALHDASGRALLEGRAAVVLDAAA